jgi:hypothetical protein
MLESFFSSASEPFSHPAVLLVLCGAIIVLALSLWVGRPEKIIPAFSTAHGSVAVTRRALHDLVQGRCLTYKGVGQVKVDVALKSGRLQTRLAIRVRPNIRLDELSQQLQTEVTALLKDNLGLANVGDVDVLVAGIAE